MSFYLRAAPYGCDGISLDDGSSVGTEQILSRFKILLETCGLCLKSERDAALLQLDVKEKALLKVFRAQDTLRNKYEDLQNQYAALAIEHNQLKLQHEAVEKDRLSQPKQVKARTAADVRRITQEVFAVEPEEQNVTSGS